MLEPRISQWKIWMLVGRSHCRHCDCQRHWLASHYWMYFLRALVRLQFSCSELFYTLHWLKWIKHKSRTNGVALTELKAWLCIGVFFVNNTYSLKKEKRKRKKAVSIAYAFVKTNSHYIPACNVVLFWTWMFSNPVACWAEVCCYFTKQLKCCAPEAMKQTKVPYLKNKSIRLIKGP